MSVEAEVRDIEEFYKRMEVIKKHFEVIVIDNTKKLSEVEKNTTHINELTNMSENKIEQKLNQSVKKPTATIPRKSKQLTKGWFVNLVSFNQEWQANKKAAEFGKKGIPVEVSQVSINGKKWYRIAVGGFKTKQEAQSYMTKVKKVLGLNSVWMTGNK